MTNTYFIFLPIYPQRACYISVCCCQYTNQPPSPPFNYNIITIPLYNQLENVLKISIHIILWTKISALTSQTLEDSDTSTWSLNHGNCTIYIFQLVKTVCQYVLRQLIQLRTWDLRERKVPGGAEIYFQRIREVGRANGTESFHFQLKLSQKTTKILINFESWAEEKKSEGEEWVLASLVFGYAWCEWVSVCCSTGYHVQILLQLA